MSFGLAMLSQFLTLEAVACPWNSVEAFRFNVTTALSALSECSFANPFKSMV